MAHLAEVTADESSMEYYQLAFLSLDLMAAEDKEAVFRRLHESMFREYDQPAQIKSMLQTKYQESKQAGTLTINGLWYDEQSRERSSVITAFPQNLKPFCSEQKTVTRKGG